MTSDFEFREQYYRWLTDLVNADDHNVFGGYWVLLRKLHRKEFYSTIRMDENRADDGVLLRDKFCSMVNSDRRNCLDGPCSVLEMLIALASRCDDILLDFTTDYASRIFWEMLKNLGLTVYTDKHYREEDVDYILEKWLDRSYDYDGEGGIFPLENPHSNQKLVEIWYQMQSYLQENYEL